MFARSVQSIFILMLLTHNIFGQYESFNYSVGLRGGYSQFNINSIIELSNQGNSNYEKKQGGISISGNFSYYIFESVSISFNVGYNYSSSNGKGYINRTSSVSPDVIGIHEYEGQYKTKLIPISLRFLFRSNINSFKLNYGLGINYYWGEVSLTNNFSNPVQIEVEQVELYKINNRNSGSGIGLSILVEPELFFSKNWSAVSEISYTYGNFLGKDVFSKKCQISINGVSVQIGLNYYL